MYIRCTNILDLLRNLISLKVQTGYIYHIKDEFFDKINDKGIMINHENGHSRPTYFTIKDKDILWFIPLSSKIDKYKKIIESYKKFVIINNIKFNLNKDMLFSIIKEIFDFKVFNKDILEKELESRNYEITKINELLSELIILKKIKKSNDNFYVVKPKIIDELKKVSEKNNHYDIVMKKLSGRTLESIGTDYKVTRERIRQIIQKELSKLNPTQEEDEYKEIIETYNIDCDLFCQLFQEDQIVYYYLREKYKIGTKESVELIEEINLDTRQISVLNKKYNLINYYGENVIARKTDILLAILKNNNGLMEYSEMISEYNRLIELNDLEIEKLGEEDFRNIDSILNRSVYILCDVGRYYRYFDVDSLDETDITDIKEMLNVESGDYSSEFFFNNNQLLMKKIDIRNEYELHNFLRKFIGNYNGKIIYSRMPDIFIDCEDKYSFVENLIQELSPISVDEFVDYVYQNYGHKYSTFRSLLTSNFDKYITNGTLISECPEFTQEQLRILKEKLTEDIYSIMTIKELLTDLFDVNDFKLINNINMSKLGYRLRGNYIMKISITNLESYLRNIILSSEYYEIKPEMKKIGSTFPSYLYRFIYDLDIFKIDNDKYITIKKLNELGITKDDIKIFINEINKIIKENEYFNLYTLDKENYLTNLKKYNFPACFYENIISTIPEVKTLSLKNNSIFIKTNEQATREKFINSFITKDKIFISEIKNKILSLYNIDLQEYYIKEFINKKKFYLDNSIDCVYLNKDIYEKEINNFDILQYID